MYASTEFMRPGRRLLLALLACLALTHCAQLPKAPEEPVRWQQHRAQVEALQSWTLSGKVGIRSAEENGSARLRWQQAPSHYQVQLSGPLGQGTVRISGSEGGARLEQSGEPPLEASSGEQLLYEATGWTLPLEQLTAWVRGIPADTLPIEHMHFDEHHLLAELHQAGWQLSYSRYGLYQEAYLPGRIVATREDIRLTLLIHDWQVPRD